MEHSIFRQLLLQLFLIFLNAVFACAEIAVLSSNKNKLKLMVEKGDKRAERLLFLSEQPSSFLATIQVGITLAGFLASAFAADTFSDKMVNSFVNMGITLSPSTLDTISVIIITLILSYFTLIFGELVPKRIAQQKAEEIGLFISSFILATAKTFSPLVSFLTFSTNSVLKLLGFSTKHEVEEITEEEIKMMIDLGSRKGTIDIGEKQIIHNVFEFDDKEASDIMTHRSDVIFLWTDKDDMEWERVITENRYAMYPICDKSRDNIIGVLSSKDYLRLKQKDRKTVMERAVKVACLIPETLGIDIVFRNMKKDHNHFAIVMDEYGIMIGILTMNQLLEQLVGDLEDDLMMPKREPLIKKIGENEWEIRGRTLLLNVAKALEINLPSDDYDTFSGFVFDTIGMVPKDGETPEINTFGLIIKVMEIKNHKVKKAKVSKQSQANTL